MAAQRDPRLIAVCIATYRRSEGLRNLLNELLRQTFLENSAARVAFVVVDNDDDGSALDVCREFDARRWPLHYAIESRRGIPQARNRAVAIAEDIGAGLVAFIDDDELPEPDWLDRLVSALTLYGGEAVQGRAIPHFVDQPAAWMIENKVFELLQRETGDRLSLAATNNILIKMELFEKVGRFEESWALCGGTDTLLFSKAAQAGLKIVWADDAVTYELVNAKRATTAWLYRRAARIGITHSRVKAVLEPGWRTRLRFVAMGASMMGTGLLRLLWPPLREEPAIMTGYWCLVGAGLVSGALNLGFDEYK